LKPILVAILNFSRHFEFFKKYSAMIFLLFEYKIKQKREREKLNFAEVMNKKMFLAAIFKRVAILKPMRGTPILFD
jgi:hypothetical protein